MAKRQWIPAAGDRVRLKAFWMYTALKPVGGVPAPGVWSPLTVVRVTVVQTSDACAAGTATVGYIPVGAAADTPAWECAVPLADLERPLGWKSAYDIYATQSPDAAGVIGGWFTRGIAVWTSHDLSAAGRMAFTPLTDGMPSGSPHWQFTANPVEVVPPELCPKVFTVWQQHEGSLDLAPGYKGHGTEAEVKASEKKAVAWLKANGWTCRRRGSLWEVWKDELKHRAEYDND